MTVRINSTGLKTYLTVLGLVVLCSAFENQLRSMEQFRLEWVYTLDYVETGKLGLLYSASMFLGLLMAAFIMYGFWQKVQYLHTSSDVIVNNYHGATYKKVSKEEYALLLTEKISDALKNEVIAEHGMVCYFTGKKLYTEPPGKIRHWLWQNTKDSNYVALRLISLMAEKNLLDIGHIIPRRIKGPNKKWNLVPEDRSHNRRTGAKLTGKKRRAAIKLARERGETIDRGALN